MPIHVSQSALNVVTALILMECLQAYTRAKLPGKASGYPKDAYDGGKLPSDIAIFS